MTRAALLIAAVAVTLVTNACDSSESDRAGGENPAEPPAGRATTLTLANVNSEPDVLQRFAEKVEELSNGTLRVRFENSWGQGRDGNAEVNLIRDVKAGKADLGWAGSRAFDLVGDRAFGPLHAPMMIDSYALELKVLEDEGVVRPMLASLEPLGLEGVGVLPGPLRRPLATRRLVAPSDWSGMRIGHAGGEQIERSLRALGARPRIIVSSGEFTALDGVESHVASIAGNGYHHQAPYLTGNVVLWPRPLVLFADDGVGQAQLALMRQAFRPVYGSLERDAATRSTLARIERIASSLGEPVEAVSCGEQAPPSAAAIPDGTYEVTVTPRDSIRAGIAPDDPIVRAGAAHFRLELDKGNYTVVNTKDPDPGEGTYSVYRDRIELKFIDGGLLAARWTFEDGRLRFEDVRLPRDARGTRYARAVWSSQPWTKVR